MRALVIYTLQTESYYTGNLFVELLLHRMEQSASWLGAVTKEGDIVAPAVAV